MKLSIKQLLEATDGELLSGNISVGIHSISTDTRTLQPGSLFVCLKGGNFDGHLFIDQAIEKGAVAVLIENSTLSSIEKNPEIPFILVSDTLRGLGDLAHFWRKYFQIPVIAITGSNGKTTTKDLTAALLSDSFSVLATDGNLNNLIGVPQMIFRLGSEHQLAILEMGMNDFGEIDRLSEIAEPTVGLITNVGDAHIEKLKTREGIAKAKGELFNRLSSQAVAIVNLDDPLVFGLPTQAKKFTFSFYHSADLFGKNYELYEDEVKLEVIYQKESYFFSAPIFGKTGVQNLLAALAIGFSLHVSPESMQRGLSKFQGRKMRMEKIFLKGGVTLLNDCYNANPSSVLSALQTLGELKKEGKALAVLGEMLELGDFRVEGHRKVGLGLGEQKIDYLIAVGPSAEEVKKAGVESGLDPEKCLAVLFQEEAKEKLAQWGREVNSILIKGSRGSKMEQLTDYLCKQFGSTRG